MTQHQAWLAVCFVVVTVAAFTDCYGFTPDCASKPNGWIRHPNDCRTYYRCVWTRPVKMKPCPKGLVFSTRVLTCVSPHSRYNNCNNVGVSSTTPATTTSSGMSVEERCKKNSSAIFPHPGQCQLYYNCSNDAQPHFRSFFDRYMEECHYPQLFNEDTNRCEDYTTVDCGCREEHVDPCSYLRNKCPVAHCIPCSVVFPNCSGKPDGRNEHTGKLWSPWYGVCQDERTIDIDTCPVDPKLGVAQLFSPDLRRCASIYEIPEQHGGLYLNCSGRADGLHPDYRTSRPDLYFSCGNGELLAIELCPDNTVFNANESQCTPRASGPIP